MQEGWDGVGPLAVWGATFVKYNLVLGSAMGIGGLIMLGALPACGGDDDDADDNGDEAGEGPVGAPRALAATWSHYGFDHGNSRHNLDEVTLDVDNVADLELAWEIPLRQGMTGTPAVVDGIAYFVDWTGDVYAVDVADGAVQWMSNIGSGRGSIAVDGDRLYVGSNRSLHVLNREDGEPIWQTVLDDHPNTLMDSSPVVVDGQVIMGVAAFEIVYDKDDYSFSGSIVALDADSGAENWRVYVAGDETASGNGVSVWSSAAIDTERKRMFIGTGNSLEAPASPRSDSVVAIDYETGDVAWVYQFTEGDVYTTIANGPGPDADIGASPNLFSAGGRDMVGVGDKAGWYRALDRDDGSLVWERKLGPGSPVGGIMTTAAVDDQALYVTAQNWVTYQFVVASSPLGHSPTDTATTFALDLATGDEIWSESLTGPAFMALTLANGVLYQTTGPGMLLAREASSGNLLWEHDLERDTASGVAVVGGMLLVGEGFRWIKGAVVAGAAMNAFSLEGGFVGNPGAVLDEDPPEATEVECLEDQPRELSDACADCACACDSSAVAQCDASCWLLAECLYDSCADEDFDSDAGRQCLQNGCREKLLPARVFDAYVGAAACMLECRDSCGG